MALCSSVLCPQWCEVCGVAWGQAVRQTVCKPVVDRNGGGGVADHKTPTPPALSKLFALHWFSHQPRLLNQGPPSTKTANYAQMRCHPVPFLSPPMFSFSTLLYLVSTLSFLLRLTYFSRLQSDGKTLCCISGHLLVSV